MPPQPTPPVAQEHELKKLADEKAQKEKEDAEEAAKRIEEAAKAETFRYEQIRLELKKRANEEKEDDFEILK